MSKKRKLQFKSFVESIRQELNESGSLAWMDEYKGTRTEEEILAEINKYKTSGNYTSRKMHLLIDGIKQELPVEMYADPEFDTDQMMAIKFALEDDLTVDEVKLFNDPKYDAGHMSVIVSVLESEKDPTILLDTKWEFEQLLELEHLISYSDNIASDMTKYGITYSSTPEEMADANDKIFNN